MKESLKPSAYKQSEGVAPGQFAGDGEPDGVPIEE